MAAKDIAVQGNASAVARLLKIGRTDGFNRIRKRRTFDPGCSSPWVSSAAASGASKPKWMTKCPGLAFAEGGGEAGVCDGDRAGASVTRSHHAVKHERC